MAQRVIPCAVTHEYVAGDGVTIGAMGSHDDVLVELDFRAAGAQWAGTTRHLLWTDATGTKTEDILLGAQYLVDGFSEVYKVPVPLTAKASMGWCELVVTGVQVSDGNEVIKVQTEPSKFRVLPPKGVNVCGNNAIPASMVDQLQAEIDEIKHLVRLQWVYLFIGEDDMYDEVSEDGYEKGYLYAQKYIGQPNDFALTDDGYLEVIYS